MQCAQLLYKDLTTHGKGSQKAVATALWGRGRVVWEVLAPHAKPNENEARINFMHETVSYIG